jgi:RimJ/RimL family protein N-acetyltransferase
MADNGGAPIVIDMALGPLRLRPERDADMDFRFQLFCDSRAPEFVLLQRQLALDAFSQLMRFQFQAQSVSYRHQFPQARFDIVELDGNAIGRIVVDRPGPMLHIVDQAIVPAMRNKGIGTTIMRALMDEAARAGLPVRLKVASSNDPSMRLYERLGFVPIAAVPLYIEMEWRTVPATL